MGDMGDDIVKSLAAGCLIGMVFICAVLGGEYYLVKVFILTKFTLDSLILFVACSVFFVASMWRFYKWAVNYV
jgi:hypothetical protein